MDGIDKKQAESNELTSMLEKEDLITTKEKSVDRENPPDGEDDEATSTFQHFMELVGTNGPWNYFMFFLCATTSFSSPLQTMSYQFLGGTPGHWCHIPELVEANWTQEQILNFAIPTDNTTGKNEGCFMHHYNYSAAADLGFDESLGQLDALSLGESNIECRSRDFNYTEFQSTTVTEWDLVCNRRYLYSTTFSATFLVQLLLSPFIGYFTDAFGRRFCILLSVALYIPACFLAAASPNYEIYLILRVLITQFETGFFTASYVLCLELCGKAQRAMAGILFCIPWAIGLMVLPGIAYFVRQWRLLQVCFTIPCTYMILYFWFLPESPRWLALKGRYPEALKVLKSAAKWNKRTPLNDAEILQKMQEMHQKTHEDEDDQKRCGQFLKHVKEFLSGLKELVKSWPMFRLTSIVMFTWFSSSATYYGVSFNSVNLSANMYVYMLLGGAIELPSFLLLWPLASFMGRKKAFIFLFICCGLSILVIPILDQFAPTAPVGYKMTFSLLGKMTINMAYQLAYLYTGEIYHTSQRTFIISLGLLFSSLGGALAPYINDLVGEKAAWAPSLIFGIASILAGLLTVPLPETKGEELPDNIETVKKSATV